MIDPTTEATTIGANETVGHTRTVFGAHDEDVGPASRPADIQPHFCGAPTNTVTDILTPGGPKMGDADTERLGPATWQRA